MVKLKTVFPIEKIIFYTRTGLQYEIDYRNIIKFQSSVISYFEDITYDHKNNKQTLSKIKKCKKIGVCVQINNIADQEEKERLEYFFSGVFGTRNVVSISMILEDGSKIDYFVPKQYRKHLSFQKIYKEHFGVCFLGLDKGTNEFLADCGFLKTEE